MRQKLILGGLIGLGIIGFLAWVFNETTPKNLPGQKVEDEGQGHVTIGTQVEYKTNPPASGQHYEDWIRAGVYSESKDDRNLVHSLEHGYVIISYNCQIGKTPDLTGESTSSANLPTQECKNLENKLISIFEKKARRKLIVLPRPNLDSKIALTAWTYLDKFDEFDAARIENFIDGHRDKGPERTME